MRTLARFVSGRRTAWAVLVATAVAVALLFAFLPSSEGDAAPPSGVPASSQSAEVTALLERFPSSDTTVGILVFSDGGDTLDDRALAAISARASALAELSTAPQAVRPQISDDGTAALIAVCLLYTSDAADDGWSVVVSGVALSLSEQ
ncbi:MMPL family transporter, partial [Frigoribacterium faeni]|nr:MMPL family transporter [Frigoribacterium faeni]